MSRTSSVLVPAHEQDFNRPVNVRGTRPAVDSDPSTEGDTTVDESSTHAEKKMKLASNGSVPQQAEARTQQAAQEALEMMAALTRAESAAVAAAGALALHKLADDIQRLERKLTNEGLRETSYRLYKRALDEKMRQADALMKAEEAAATD